MSATARTRIYSGYYVDEAEEAFKWIDELLTIATIEGATLYRGIGYWKAANEVAIIIEIIGDTTADDFNIDFIANSLKNSTQYPQKEVWIVRELVDLVVV